MRNGSDIENGLLGQKRFPMVQSCESQRRKTRFHEIHGKAAGYYLMWVGSRDQSLVAVLSRRHHVVTPSPCTQDWSDNVFCGVFKRSIPNFPSAVDGLGGGRKHQPHSRPLPRRPSEAWPLTGYGGSVFLGCTHWAMLTCLRVPTATWPSDRGAHFGRAKCNRRPREEAEAAGGPV